MQTGYGLLGMDWAVPGIRLPIGISFFTFQALSYVIDVYRDRDCVQRSLPRLLLYISFFPQLIAGPIVKYHDIREQLAARELSMDGSAEGLRRFLYGLAKKVLIANSMAVVADYVFALPGGSLTALSAWMGALCYLLQIYFDFSGFSDMAIGVGRMFGLGFLVVVFFFVVVAAAVSVVVVVLSVVAMVVDGTVASVVAAAEDAGGVAGQITGSRVYKVKEGPFLLKRNGSEIDRFANLTEVKGDSVDGNILYAGSRQYTIAEDALVTYSRAGLLRRVYPPRARRQAAEEGEVPVGAVAVSGGKVIAAGRNRRELGKTRSATRNWRRLTARAGRWAAGGFGSARYM